MNFTAVSRGEIQERNEVMEMNEKHDQIMEEITALKILLHDTDYEVTKYAEGLTACTTQKQIEAYRAAFMEQYGEIIESRRLWRAKINELEPLLESAMTEALETSESPEMTEETETAETVEEAEEILPEQNQSDE